MILTIFYMWGFICFCFCFFCHMYVFLGEMSSAHFWLGCLFFDIEPYEIFCTLEINPFSVTSFANIFSHAEGGLFVLFRVSFAVQKLISLIRFLFFYFCFYFHYSRRWIWKRIAVVYARVFCLCFLCEFYSIWSYI